MFSRTMALGFCLAGSLAEAQVCRLSVAGLNQSRRVIGPITSECPGRFIVHTAPFGNWGVTSNFGPKLDGHQFQGWCNNTHACDNEGRCGANCRDGWFEWNGCTSLPRFAAPNCTLYNSENCTQQVSTTGVNVLGTQTVDVPVRCPFDSNGDALADQGGCKDVASYSHGTNFMSIYELDPASPDELIQTLYFPPTSVTLDCALLSCPPAGSQWVPPASYQDPASPAKVYAEMATVVNSGVFLDQGACRVPAATVRHVSAASYTGVDLAMQSIVAALGDSLAVATEAAGSALLPTSLAGTTVRITDSLGVSRLAPLFFVSPRQVNYLMPSGLALGQATIEIRSINGILSRGSIRIAQVAPGLFTANGDGQGVAAASAIRVARDGSRAAVPVFQCDGVAGCSPIPIDLGPPGAEILLSLHGTGIRAAGSVVAVAGGVQCDVLYAGQQGHYPGLDQVNIRLNPALRGRGTVFLTLAAGGRVSNAVTIRIQ